MMNSQSYKKLKTQRNAKKISIKTLKHEGRKETRRNAKKRSIKTLKHEGRKGNTKIHKGKKNKVNFVYFCEIFVFFAV